MLYLSISRIGDTDESIKLLKKSAEVFEGDTAKSYVYAYGDNGYKGNVYDYNKGFNAVYMAQQQGKSINEAYDIALDKGSHITPIQATIAYDAAKNDTAVAEFKDALSSPIKIGATVVAKSVDKEQQSTISFINEMAKTAGVEVVIPARMQDVGLKDANGAYVNGKIVLPLDNESKMMNIYLGHEMFHHFKVNAPESADFLQNTIIEKLKADGSYKYNERLEKIINDYGFEGTREQQVAAAHEEMAANACFTVFSNEANVKQLVAQDRTLAQKVRDFFAGLIDRMKKAIAVISNNAEYRAFSDEESMQEIVDLFDNCLKESQKNNTINNDSVPSTGIKFAKKINGYPYNMQTVIKDYLNSVDDDILQFYNNAINKVPQNPKINIGKVTSQISNEISEVLGVDTEGWNIQFEDRIAKHINKDHGEKGITDKSMADSNDVARMKYVIENHDYYGSAESTEAYKIFENGRNKKAPTITFAKKINGTYYLVMAVPKKKTLWIVTAFMNKKIEAAQFRNASNEPLRHTSKNATASTSTDNVPQSETSVNSNDMQDKGKYSLKEDSDKYKERQLSIIEQYNPAPDSYHTWIRNTDDIKTFDEALSDDEYADYDEFNPDYTREMAEEALESGYIRVYSSYPIEQGVFVTPSMMEAESYSGDGNIYSKDVDVNNVAWIDITQGQYAEIGNDDIRYSLKEKPYSYEALTSKPDMKVTTVNDTQLYTNDKEGRTKLINDAIENAKKTGKINENNDIVINVLDTKTDILLSKQSLRHSLDRRMGVLSAVYLDIGNILHNSIQINELIPKKATASKSYALIGVAKNSQNEPYLVRFIVNRYTNEIDFVDVLYAINAKKEPGGSSKSPGVTNKFAPLTDSNISISNVLEFVNEYYPDLLSEDVLKHFNYNERPNGLFTNDVLYSIKEKPIDYNAVIEENAELSEMNEDLKEMLRLTSAQNEKLKNEFKITDRHNISNNAVDKVAAALRKQYSSSYDKTSLVSRLAAMYDYMANAGKDIDSAYIWLRANDIAKNIIANSQQKDTAVYDEYKELRNRIRNTAIRVPQAVQDNFAEYNAFRRENFGRLRLSKEGIELDAFYNELSVQYPEFFDVDVSEEQQLEALANFFEVTSPVYYSASEKNAESMGMNMEQYANLIAGDIIDKYFDVPKVMTAAEKHKKEMDTLKLHYRNQIDDMKLLYQKEYEDRLREIIKNENIQLIDKLGREKSEALAKQKAHFEDVSQRGKERRKKSQLRASIRKQLNKILNLANRPTKDKHIPIPIIESVRELCNAINLSDTKGDTRIKEKILNFQSALDAVSSGRYFDDLSNADKAKILMNKKIAVGMTDSERYAILKGKKIYNVPVATNVDKYGNTIIENWNDINIKVGREKQNLINRIATQFGAFKEYSNSDIELDFEFTKNNFRESYNKQGKNFDDFAKMFSVFDRIVHNAVGIEIHNRNKEGYKVDLTLENVYVLVSAFQDGDSIVPVKLEIKQFSDKPNKLYVAVTSDKIKMTEVWKQGDTINGVTQDSRSVNISISDLFKKINPESQSLYKYIPSHFKEGYEENTDFSQLKSRYADMYNELVKARIEQFISETGDKTINELSVDDLASIDELLKITITQINNINRLFLKDRNETIEKYAENISNELAPYKKEKMYKGMSKSLMYNSMKPEYFFQYLGSDTLLELYHNLRKGEDVWAVDISEARDYALKVRKKYGWQKWDNKHSQSFNTSYGKIELTLQERLAVYANSLGEHTKNHLYGGGFKYNDSEQKGLKKLRKQVNDNENHRLSESDVALIVSSLDERRSDCTYSDQ